MKTLFHITFVLFFFLNNSYTQNYSWRYYTTGNTGIQGDYSEGLWIDHDGNPYIAAYNPSFEEGGFAKFIQSENRWINYSNVDYPVIGNINDVGASRISDIVEGENGILWMAHWRGLLKFDPAIGGSSLQFWGANNSPHPGGRTRNITVAPDGSIWGVIISVTWGNGGVFNYNPATNQWRYWGYGSTANNWPSLISYAEKISIQKKPSSNGYVVWIDGVGEANVITFDSDTQLFTLHPFSYNPGQLRALPGNDCTDDADNIWVLRFVSTGNFYSLDYRTQAGNWITPPQPAANTELNIWAFKAYGNGKALLIDGNSELWQFNGTSWQSFGIWRQGGFSYGIDIDDNGNIWVTGLGGAAKRDALTGLWQRHRITNSSQIDYWVRDLSIDDSGNVWMTGNAGAGYGGFQKFDGTRWTGFNNHTYGLGYPFPFPSDNSEVVYYRPSNGNVIVNPTFGYLHSWNSTSYTSLNYPNDRSKGVIEDSQNRLWCLGEYYNLKYYNDAANSWTAVTFSGWGANIMKDPTRPGTIWAASGFQVLRTDGSYNFTRFNTDFPELNPQSDLLTTVAPAQDGIAWVGSNKGLFKLNANNGTYQFYSPQNSQIPGNNISPLAVTADGRVWFSNFQSTTTSIYGLCWFDGTNFGIIPQQQTGGLPHAQIYDVEIKNTHNGYELWISCASRGVAVLTVTGTVIPVELISLSATLSGNNVLLNWSTASETNNLGFEIEKRTGNAPDTYAGWTTIGFIKGRGTTTEVSNYAYTDNFNTSHNPSAERQSHIIFYRLKQLDLDGNYNYSNIIEVELNLITRFMLEQNYPNPFNPSTVISWQSPVGSHQILKVFDVLGNEVAALIDKYLPAGRHEVEFNASGLASGVYYYRIQTGEFSQSKKMIVIK